MKKAAILALALGSVLFVFSAELSAQQFNITLGVITEQNFSFSPFMASVGMYYDIEIMPNLFLDPEFSWILQNFQFGTTWLAPGLILNYVAHLGQDSVYRTNFFIGGGFSKWVRLGPEGGYSPWTDVALKMNVGVEIPNQSISLIVFMETPFGGLFDRMRFGIVLGIH